jgi:Helix-turn-helix family
VADAASTARTMWTLFEPVHAVTYFTADSRSAYERAGLRGFWRGYFAGRAAPLGAVSAPVVAASFFNFAPAFVGRAIPGVWELITPEEALRARLEGAVGALRGLLAGRESEAVAAADLLWRAVEKLDFPGRMLSAANAALPVPEDGLARLWQAATVLREHRGDGHFAALTAADIDGCEAVALRCLMDMKRENLQPVRGWTDEAWDDALTRLAARGWIDEDGGDGVAGGANGVSRADGTSRSSADGVGGAGGTGGADGAGGTGGAGTLTLTSAGREAHAAVENATDRAAARPWAKLGPEATAEIAAALTPISQACASVLPFPSPIGLPAPAPPGEGAAAAG